MYAGEFKHPQSPQVVRPRLLDGTEPVIGPMVDRRETLAEWVVSPSNPYFARATVNRVWKQELALASGTNQAHISRIEADLKHPQYSTLLRLCEALEMPAAKQCYLLALAGYRVEPKLPSKEEVNAALRSLAPVIDRYPYSALLMDVGERIWSLNSLVAELWGPCWWIRSRLACWD